MPDNLTPHDRRKAMQAVKSKNTSLERKLFATLAGMRLRGWKRNAQDVLGKPDAVFETRRVAIFVNGCFWHGCPECQRKLPETNRQYWERKIGRNIERDALNRSTLIEDGWVVITIWEHEFKTSRERIRRDIRLAVEMESS